MPRWLLSLKGSTSSKHSLSIPKLPLSLQEGNGQDALDVDLFAWQPITVHEK